MQWAVPHIPSMIDWKISNGAQTIQREGWSFPSFEMQEYLLPILNVGFGSIDEYGDTLLHREDSIRMKAVIGYMLESGLVSRRSQLRFDTLEKGIVILQCPDIEACLIRLREALDHALSTGGSLVFYGD